MPCSSPPGIFDLLTPHTLYISLLGGLLFPGFFLGLVGVWVVSFARLLRRNAPIWQAHWGLRWQARLSIGGLGLCILLMSVGGLWSAALDAWVHQVYYCVAPLEGGTSLASSALWDAYTHFSGQADQVIVLAFLLCAIGGASLTICDAWARRLVDRRRNEAGVSE